MIKKLIFAALIIIIVSASVILYMQADSIVSAVRGNMPEDLKIPVRLRKNVSLKVYSANNALIYDKTYIHSKILKNTEETDQLIDMVSVVDRNIDNEPVLLSLKDKAFLKFFEINPENLNSSIASFYADKILYSTKTDSYSMKLLKWYVMDRLIKEHGFRNLYLSYINSTFIGEHNYGIAAASEYYFGVPFGELDISRKALLVGISWNFDKYSLTDNFSTADRRRRVILYNLYEKNVISYSEYIENLDRKITFVDSDREPELDSYVRFALKEFESLKIEVCRDISVYTHLDLEKTEAVKKSMRTHLNKVGFEDAQAGFALVNAESGGVEVLIGSSKSDSLYRAVDYKSQIGSTFKPIVYITAIENGFTPADLIDDKPYDFGGYRPSNFEDVFLGRIPIRKGLVYSLNNTTIRLAKEVGLKKVQATADKMGMGGGVKPYLSTPLGTNVTTPLNVAMAYSTLASYGLRKDIRVIKRVTDETGQSYDLKINEPQRAFSARTAFQVLYIMQDVANIGTARGAGFLKGTSAKTGTTDEYRDALTLAVFGNYVAVCRVGYDNKKSMGDDGTGGHMAAPIIAGFQRAFFGSKTTFELSVPEGIVFRKVNPWNGILLGKGCSKSRFYTEAFKAEDVENKSCVRPNNRLITGEKREWKPNEVARKEIKELRELDRLMNMGKLNKKEKISRYSELLSKYGSKALEESS